MASQLVQCIKDIIPGYQTELPIEVTTCAKSLYLLSLRKTPVLHNRSEIARSHVCAFLAVEKYAAQFNLPRPDIGKVPLKPKLVDKIVHDFRENLLNQIRSPNTTPNASPLRHINTKIDSSPTKSSSILQKNENPHFSSKDPNDLEVNTIAQFSLSKNHNDLENDESTPLSLTKITIISPSTKAYAQKSPYLSLNAPFHTRSPTPRSVGSDSATNRLYSQGATPLISSPLKRVQELSNDVITPPRKRGRPRIKDLESPFNPNSGNSLSTTKTETPLTSVYYYNKKHVSIPELIAFANAFYIPGEFSPRLVESFVLHKHKFTKKSEWLLASGLVYAAYTRINQLLLQQKIGAKLEFVNHLFQYQKGGLMSKDLILWCELVDGWVKKEGWIHEIEEKYMFSSEFQSQADIDCERNAREGLKWRLLERFGPMIHGDVLYLSRSQTNYYVAWSSKMLQLVTSETEG